MRKTTAEYAQVVLEGTLDSFVSEFGTMLDFRDVPWMKDAFVGKDLPLKEFRIIIYSGTLDRRVAQEGREVYGPSGSSSNPSNEGAGGFNVKNRELATRIIALPGITQRMMYEMIRKAFAENPDTSRIDIEVKWSRIGRRRTIRVFGSDEAVFFQLDLL